jgi:predicted acetyltransferase
LAFYLFDQFPGKWEVRTLEKNLIAQIFWRKIIKQYTSESVQESLKVIDNWQNFIWTFTSNEVKSQRSL